MHHFTEIAGMDAGVLREILSDAQLDQKRAVLNPGPIALVFHEPSTRTRFSFASAALQVGHHPVDLNVGESSERKGETTLDTCRNLAWGGARAVILRTSKTGLPREVAGQLDIPVINAGDGTNEHPTQALGDALTLLDHFGHLDGLRVTIVGDIAASRVARSNAHLLSLFGADLRLMGSRIPDDLPGEKYTKGHNFVRALEGADVVMILRWQDERHTWWPYD